MEEEKLGRDGGKTKRGPSPVVTWGGVGIVPMVRPNILMLRSDMHPSVTQIPPPVFERAGSEARGSRRPRSLASLR